MIKNYTPKNNFTDLYKQLLNDLLFNYDYQISPRGIKVNELLNVSISIDPNDCHIDFNKTGLPERQAVYDKYCADELAWYLSGNLKADSAPSKFWLKLADKEGNITSNYGFMQLYDKIFQSQDGMKTNFERVVDVLTADKDSRQAIIFYGQPKHYYEGNLDQTCTLCGQFFIRDNKLHFTVTQRSCDIWLGFSFDIPWQCYYQRMILTRLKLNGMNIELGEYNHFFGSLHIYERNTEAARKLLS